MRIQLCMALLAATTLSASAQDSAGPFGLTWLVTSEQVKQLGVTLTPAENSNFGTSYMATNLPKALSDLDMVFLSFGYDDRLWRVAALGEENENDKYGFEGKARYDELKSSLGKSYTLQQSGEKPSSDSFYGKPENFAYSLSENEAFWYSTFSSPSADIELSLNSDHYDTYWRIIYSNREGEELFTSGKKDAEIDAL